MSNVALLTSEDFHLSGAETPLFVTGIAIILGNLIAILSLIILG
jgi:hypothetical protein